MQLRSSDWRASVQVLQGISARSSDWREFALAGVEALSKLVASEITTLSVCDLYSGKRQVVGAADTRIGNREREAFDLHFDDHPLVRFHGFDGGRCVQRISDSMDFARFRHSALYSDYYRRIGIDHAVALPLSFDGRVLVSFVLNRVRCDFSDRERNMLEATREPLARLFQLTRALDLARNDFAGLACLTERGGGAWLRLGAARELQAASAHALQLLERFSGTAPQLGQPLAPRLDHWLHSVPSGDPTKPSTVVSLHLCDCGDRLLVHALRMPGVPGSFHLRLQLQLAAAHRLDSNALPLTPREHQVMQAVAAGKTDREVAALLQCSHRTVQKHLERIYPKLGVETRTAAVMRLLAHHQE